VNERAYSKPISALQSGIRYFSREFWRTSVALERMRHHMMRETAPQKSLPAPTGRAEISSQHPIRRPRIPLFGRELAMPQSRKLRIVIGMLLVIFGLLGFLPVLGFWMVPLGILILSYEFASVRRFRRRSVVWWERRKRPPAP
jgi:hypothetical protein